MWQPGNCCKRHRGSARILEDIECRSYCFGNQVTKFLTLQSFRNFTSLHVDARGNSRFVACE